MLMNYTAGRKICFIKRNAAMSVLRMDAVTNFLTTQNSKKIGGEEYFNADDLSTDSMDEQSVWNQQVGVSISKIGCLSACAFLVGLFCCYCVSS